MVKPFHLHISGSRLAIVHLRFEVFYDRTLLNPFNSL